MSEEDKTPLFEGKKIEIARQDFVDSYDDVAKVFFKEIFDMKFPEEVLITDESSLFDFCLFDTEEKNDKEEKRIISLIEENWCDISDIKDSYLYEIFERIAPFIRYK